MLCHLSQTSFAVLPPSHDTLTFVDSSSNITRIECDVDEDNGVLGYRKQEDQVVVWSRTTGDIKLRFSDGKERHLTKVPNMVQLTRFGEFSYCAYCEAEDQGSIVLLEGEKLDQETTVFTHPRKRREGRKTDAGPCAYSFDDNWNCAVFTRRDTLFVVRRAASASQPTSEEKVVFSLRNREDISAVAMTFVSNSTRGELSICAGSKSGKIRVYRVTGEGQRKDTLSSEHHWHSGPVNALCLVDHNHLVSGGEEGVIVLWRLDRGSASMTFRPRLGAAIVAGSALPWISSSSTDKQQITPSCLLLLADGCVLDVEVPTLVLNRRIRAWIPSNSLLAVPTGVLKQDESTKYLAVALDNHRPGALTFIDADLRDSTAEERVLDIAIRNAVSTADSQSRSRLEEVRFSPNGKTIAAVLSTGGKPGSVGGASSVASSRKWELRVFFKEQEVLRVPLALGERDEETDIFRERRRRRILDVTDESIALVDPNALGKVLVFKMAPSTSGALSGDFILQRVMDVEPQEVIAVALSDDESCLAGLFKNGAVRLWNRANGYSVATHSIIGGAADGVAGIGFAKGSRELFVWNSTRIDALLHRRSFIISSDTNISHDGEQIVCATVSPALESVAFLVRHNKIGSKKSKSSPPSAMVGLYIWAGHDSEAEGIKAVEPALDWERVEYCGASIGWLLQRLNGSLQTRGGKNTVVPKRRENSGAQRLLPTLQLRKDIQPTFNGHITIQADQKKSSIFTTEWCKDLPSHLLPAPPVLEIVWPMWEEKSSIPVLPTVSVSRGDNVATPALAMTSHSKRQRRMVDDSTSSAAIMVVEEETDEQRGLLERAFRATNGVIANGEHVT